VLSERNHHGHFAEDHPKQPRVETERKRIGFGSAQALELGPENLRKRKIRPSA